MDKTKNLPSQNLHSNIDRKISKAHRKLEGGDKRKLRKKMQCMQGRGEKMWRVAIFNRVVREELTPDKIRIMASRKTKGQAVCL